jgi:putative transposase
MDIEVDVVPHYGFCIDDLYHRSRTHLSLKKDTPERRSIQRPNAGRIMAIPEVGGLHHRYERRAA